ncbi:hypothetical protein [Bradyrhizobium roseum]|uniref:hypothetical protein n=1 Tax=Bradyrhizobium roseum TaxID=3056648 RepID=UPI00260FCC79|nr:hypothetical protein [Bradyrhizobium roseus]WKA31607.1 hypothetical protein QUH67_16235 [Bradyrhizobium roseus]
MTVLAAAQAAGQLLLGRKPGSLFGSDPFGLELGVLANEAALAIAEYHDWQKLKILKTEPGNGVAIAFNLPTDYGRMLKKPVIHSSTWRNANYRQARDEDEWIYLQDTNISGTPGVWIMLGGQLQIFPPMPASENARYYYISNKLVATSDGAAGSKASFTADGDAFVLSERLLKLALMWRWRSLKRMEYSEDLTNYEIALAEEVTKDRPRPPLVAGRQRVPTEASMAYPGTIVP